MMPVLSWNEFVAIVVRKFEYLETDYGFRLSAAKEPFVEYESSSLRINVFWDRSRRHELDLGVVPLRQVDRAFFDFGIESLAKRWDRKKGNKYVTRYPTSEKELEAGVQEMADLLRKHGENLLKGDLRDLFAIAEEDRREVARRRPKGARHST